MKPKAYSLASLYSGQPPAFDFDELLDAVVSDKRLGEFGAQILTRVDGRAVSIDFGRHFIMQLNIGYERLPEQEMAIALQGAKATSVKNKFGPIIAEHQSHIKITSNVEESQSENLAVRRLRLYAMQMVTEYLFRFEKPVLLYSDLAQSLTLPSKSPQSYFGQFDSSIFEQAVLSARGGAVGSGAPVGAHAWGSEELIGKPVVFKPTSFPSWVVTEGVTQFFAFCDFQGIPNNNVSFTDGEDTETYHVEHFAPGANYPRGRLEVTIERNLASEEKNFDGSLARPELMGSGQLFRKPQDKPVLKPAKRRFSGFALLVCVTMITTVAMFYLKDFVPA
jgi:hypothetical protein